MSRSGVIAAPPAADLLAFEVRHPERADGKEKAIREELGMGSTRYYQLLCAVVYSKAGLEADASTCYRVQRIIAANRARREALFAARQGA